MMSRTLSINLLKGETRRKLWLYIITVIVMAFLRPVRLLIAIESMLFNSSIMSQEELVDQISTNINYRGGNNLFIVVIFAICYAFAAFGYLYSKSKVDFYHSLPVKRTTMYGVFSLASILPYYIIETIVFGCNISILASKGLLIDYSMELVFSTYIYNLVIFVLFFSITAIAIALTGQILTGVLGTLILIFGWTSISDLINSYKSICYQTFYMDSNFSWIDFIFSPISSVSSLKPLIHNGGALFLAIIILALVLFIVGLIAFDKRPSESVNKAISYRIMNPVIRIIFVICIALGGGLYVVMLSAGLKALWYWVAVVISGVVAHGLANGIMHSDIKKAMCNWGQLIISIAVAAAIAAFFIYDLGQYDRYNPKESSVEYAGIDFTGINGDMGYYEFEESALGYSLEYMDMSKYRLDHMRFEDIKEIKELTELGINSLNPIKSALERNSNIDETYDGEEKNVFIVKYHLKSGRDVYRRYYVNMDDSYALTEKIYNSDNYKNAILQMQEFIDMGKITTITGYDRFSETAFVLKDDQAVELAKALLKDYRETTLDAMADEYPVISMSSYDSGKLFYEDCTSGYYIYPSFRNSLELLSSYGIDIDTSDFKIDVNRIHSITISRYDVNLSEPIEVRFEAGTDDEMIERLNNIMVIDNFTYVNSVLKKFEYNIDINCDYTDDKGYLVTRYMRMPKGLMPDEIMSELNS